MSFLSPWLRSARISVALHFPRLKTSAACLSTVPPSENPSSERVQRTPKSQNVTEEPRPIVAFRRFGTLNPHRLRKSDFVELGGKLAVCQVENMEQGVYSKKMQFIYGLRLPFPPETHGFFYYWANPDILTEGQIRFRVTRDSEPSSFASGSDLLALDGLPWCITLFQAFTVPGYSPLGELLAKENMGIKEIAEQARSLCTRLGQMARWRLHVKRIRPVMKLGQVFPMYLSSPTFVIWTDREDVATKTRNFHPWTYFFTNPRTHRKSAYSAFDAGLIHVCFEQSPLSDHDGKRVLALRLVRIVEPIRLKPPEQINRKRQMPSFEEGRFIVRATNKLWTIDCEGSGQRAIAFRRLFDGQMPDTGAVAEEGKS